MPRPCLVVLCSCIELGVRKAVIFPGWRSLPSWVSQHTLHSSNSLNTHHRNSSRLPSHFVNPLWKLTDLLSYEQYLAHYRNPGNANWSLALILSLCSIGFLRWTDICTLITLSSSKNPSSLSQDQLWFPGHSRIKWVAHVYEVRDACPVTLLLLSDPYIKILLFMALLNTFSCNSRIWDLD